MKAFNARNVAKYAAQAVVHHYVAGLTTTIIVDHTELDEDDLVVEIGAHVTGWMVSDKLRPVTDAIVDKTADFVTTKRAAHAAKKTAKKTEE